MASAKTAVAKPAPGKGTAVVSWKDKLKGYAQESASVAEQVGGGGNFISFKAGQISYNGQACAGNKLDVIIAEAVFEHAYYQGDYDPDNPQPPVCFAFGKDEKTMVPHEKSAQPQAESCAECELNKFGSADKGKGKACKNVMRLALLPAKPLEAEILAKAEAAYAKLPVTSVKGYGAYALKLKATHDLPPFAFVTQIGTVPDPKSQFKVTFEDVAKLDHDDELMEVLVQRHEEQAELIEFPYQPPSEEEKPAKKLAGKRKF